MALKSKKNIQRNATVGNANSIVFRGIATVMQSNNVWVGTMTELTTALNRVLSRKQRTLLPKSPSALRLKVNQVVNRLRNRGIGVRFGRTTDHVRTRFVRFAR